MAQESTRVINLYISYALEDEDLLRKFEKHIYSLKNSGCIKTFAAHDIPGGGNYKHEKETQLQRADIILLLISPDFLASDECSAEFQVALVRYNASQALVLPILLRPAHWEISPVHQFWVLPSNRQPVCTWDQEDDAFLHVARGIHELVKILCLTSLPYEKEVLQQAIAMVRSLLDREQIHDYTSEQYEQDIEKYIQYLEKTYQYLKIVGVAPKEQQRDPELDGIFVPLRIEVQGHTNAVEEGEDSLVDALQRYSRIILLGGPGSGKSTALRHLAWSHAQANQRETSASPHALLPAKPLPLHIELHRLSEERRHHHYSFLSYISEVILRREGIEINPQLFHDLLQQGKMLLLFDGLDEVATLNERKQLVEEIERFASNYPGNPLLVTSRPVGYDLAQFSQQWFVQAQVQDFDDQQIRQFLERWYTHALHIPELTYADQQELETLTFMLRSNPRLHKLAVNPLLLTVLTILHRYERLPDKRVLVYDRCADLLLETWARLKGTDLRWKDMKIGKEDQYACAAHLGFVLHQGVYEGDEDTEERGYGEKPATDISKRFMLREIERCIQNRKLITEVAVQRIEAQKFLDLIQIEAGLIVERGKNEQGEGLYGFLHRTFQEYFAAMDVYERFQQDTDLTVISTFLEEHLHDPHWQEVILLLLAKLRTKPVTALLRRLLEGKIKSRRSQYTEVIQQDLFFVCSCLLEGITIEAELAQDIVARLSTIIQRSSFTPQKTRALNLLTACMRTQQYGDITRQTFTALITSEEIQHTPIWLDIIYHLYRQGTPGSSEWQQIMTVLLNERLPCEQVLHAVRRIHPFHPFAAEREQNVAIQILVTLAQRPGLSITHITQIAQYLGAFTSQARSHVIQMLLNLEKRSDLTLEQALAIAGVWLNEVYDQTGLMASGPPTPEQLRGRRRVIQWILNIVQPQTLSVEQVLHLVSGLYFGMHSPEEERKQAAPILFQVAERSDLSFMQKMHVISYIYQHDHSKTTRQRVLTLLLHISQSDLSRDQQALIANRLCIYSAPSSKIRPQAIEMLAEATQLSNASSEDMIGPIVEIYRDVCKYKSSSPIIKKTATILLRLIREHPLSVEQKIHIASALIFFDSGLMWAYEQGTQILCDLAQQMDIADKQMVLAAQVLYRSNDQRVGIYGWQLLCSMIERFEENVDQAVLAALAFIPSGGTLYYDDSAKDAANILLDDLLLQPGLSPEYALEAALVLYRYFSRPDMAEKRHRTASLLRQLAQDQSLSWQQRLQGVRILYQAVSVTLEERRIITQILRQFVEEPNLTNEQKLQVLALPLTTSKIAWVERVKAVSMLQTLLGEEAAGHYLEKHWSPLSLEMQDIHSYDPSSLFELMMQEKLPVKIRDDVYSILCQLVPYLALSEDLLSSGAK